jgi:hypothetical protein
MATARVRITPRRTGGKVTTAVQEVVTAHVARAARKRAQARVDAPYLRDLSAQITGPTSFRLIAARGGPQVIRPVRKKALFWPGAPHPFAKVNGKGFGPLVAAEAGRVTEADLDMATLERSIENLIN